MGVISLITLVAGGELKPGIFPLRRVDIIMIIMPCWLERGCPADGKVQGRVEGFGSDMVQDQGTVCAG